MCSACDCSCAPKGFSRIAIPRVSWSCSLAVSRWIFSSTIFLTISRGTCSKCVFVLSIASLRFAYTSRPEVVRVISFVNLTVALVAAMLLVYASLEGCTHGSEPNRVVLLRPAFFTCRIRYDDIR